MIRLILTSSTPFLPNVALVIRLITHFFEPFPYEVLRALFLIVASSNSLVLRGGFSIFVDCRDTQVIIYFFEVSSCPFLWLLTISEKLEEFLLFDLFMFPGFCFQAR